jgi:hypothetical protein
MTPKKTVSEAMAAHVEKVGIDRRQFFITTAAVGGALVVGFGWPRRCRGRDDGCRTLVPRAFGRTWPTNLRIVSP